MTSENVPDRMWLWTKPDENGIYVCGEDDADHSENSELILVLLATPSRELAEDAWEIVENIAAESCMGGLDCPNTHGAECHICRARALLDKREASDE